MLIIRKRVGSHQCRLSWKLPRIYFSPLEVIYVNLWLDITHVQVHRHKWHVFLDLKVQKDYKSMSADKIWLKRNIWPVSFEMRSLKWSVGPNAIRYLRMRISFSLLGKLQKEKKKLIFLPSKGTLEAEWISLRTDASRTH